MSLNILTISPDNNDNFVTIDSNIIIELDNYVDPFTVANGISLYTMQDGEANLATFRYQIVDKVITLTPDSSLEPDTTYYVNIFPGNDASRYLSKNTTSNPIVISAKGNTVEIMSAYTGSTNDTIEVSFSSSDGSSVDTMDVYKGINFIGSYKASLEPTAIGDLTIKLSSLDWELTDSISIPVYKAEGLSDVYQISFTTTKYEKITPSSHRIETVSDSLDDFRVIKVTPENLSIGNKIINPIVVKFNKQLKTNQDLTNKIKIKRLNLENGTTNGIVQYYKIDGDSLKIYMITTSR